MQWILATLAAALAVATTLVLVRRRWGTERLIVAAFLATVAVIGACIVLGLADDGFGLFAVVVQAASGTALSAWAVERVVRQATVPDTLVELLAGSGAFVGGVIAGNVVAHILMSMTVPRIG